MKRAFIALASVVGVLVLAAGGFYAWATMRVNGLMSRTIETHAVEFPIPTPLGEADLAALASPDSADQVALAQAIERGRHLTSSFYACRECHGESFGGGTMIDDPAIGSLLGPNLTTGRGSVVLDYGPADWDRAVRHGVASSGRPTAMPAQDFQMMSDQELSDIVAFIRSLPPVDNEIGVTVDLGPVGTVLVALGQIPLSADMMAHHTPHSALPPETAATAEFGQHLAGVCTGCHGASLAGGPIPGGDPAWPPAKNLTPHADGLAGWTFEDFDRLMREGVRPDGSALLAPMSTITAYAANMTETELEALWAYLQSLPAVATEE